MMLLAAPRARRKSLWTWSRIFWSLVYECTVVIRPRFTSNASCSTRVMVAMQFVVHEAFDMTSWALGS